MRLEPECPRCPAAVTGTGSSWLCATHEAIVPLWRVTEPDYDSFAEYLVRARPLSSWLPWPLPDGWRVTDFGCVGLEDAGSPQAAFVTCSGPSDLDGVVELTVVTEEPGVGLAARIGAVTYTDPGREAGVGPPPTRIRVDGNSVPMWLVPTEDLSARASGALDRAVLAGEAHGRWLWLVLRPASAALLLPEMAPLHDVSAHGPQLVSLPFTRAPRAW